MKYVYNLQKKIQRNKVPAIEVKGRNIYFLQQLKGRDRHSPIQNSLDNIQHGRMCSSASCVLTSPLISLNLMKSSLVYTGNHREHQQLSRTPINQGPSATYRGEVNMWFIFKVRSLLVSRQLVSLTACRCTESYKQLASIKVRSGVPGTSRPTGC